jgi:hypothetical protein
MVHGFSVLKLESQTAHAREMVLNQLLAFVISFGRRCIEETVVSGGFSLGTSTTSGRCKLQWLRNQRRRKILRTVSDPRDSTD